MAVDAPFSGLLDYRWQGKRPENGEWVLVPLGRRSVLGLVVETTHLGPAQKHLAQIAAQKISVEAEKIKAIQGTLVGLPLAGTDWVEFLAFASRYYWRPFGTIAVGLVPKWLRDPKNYVAKKQGGKSNFDRLSDGLCKGPVTASPTASEASPVIASPKGARHSSTSNTNPVIASPKGAWQSTPNEPALNPDQLAALKAIGSPGVHVLHGVTGSGKTRVYTEAVAHCLKSEPEAQVLIMVPEIGLTPQLVDRFRQALPGIVIDVLHSEISERERARIWLSCAKGSYLPERSYSHVHRGQRGSLQTPRHPFR